MTRVGRRNSRMLNYSDDRISAEGEIGAFVWWDLVELAVRRGTLEVFLREADLVPELFLPAVQKAETHFHKAARREERSGVTITRYHPNPPLTAVNYRVDNEAFVSFDRKTENVSIEGTSPIASNILARWREYVAGQIVTTVDWRRKLEEVFMQILGGCRIRSAGPPYFILAPFLAEVRALKQVTARLKKEGHAHKASLYQVPINEPGDLAQKARLALGEELQVLASQVEEFRARKAHASTLRRRLEEFEAMQKKIELYSTFLEFDATDLKQAGQRLEQAVRELLEQR